MFLLILIDRLFYLYPLKGDCTIIMVSFPFSFLIKIFIYQGEKKKKIHRTNSDCPLSWSLKFFLHLFTFVLL